MTSDVQKAAMKLYEKIGFRKLGKIRVDAGIAGYVPEFFHGVRRVEYLYEITK